MVSNTITDMCETNTHTDLDDCVRNVLCITEGAGEECQLQTRTPAPEPRNRRSPRDCVLFERPHS
jgi:hypothetical protein